MYADTGHGLERYLGFVESQICDLLANYGPIAGIWLDLYSVPNRQPDRLDLPDLYETIRDHQPQTLISYKYGITGTEDFLAPEHEAETDHEKPTEICTTMIPGEAHADDLDIYEDASWGYHAAAKGKHKTQEEVWEALRRANENGHNLLLNTGPMPDGSIDPDDEDVFRAVGERIRSEGYPGSQ
jgi:alpha-L-fucosidase